MIRGKLCYYIIYETDTTPTRISKQMGIYVLITKTCSRDCAGLNKTQQVQAFADRIRNTQTMDYFERYHPPLLKKPIDNLRLLAEERLSGEHVVVVFRRLVTRGGHDYAALKASGYAEIPSPNDEDEISDAALKEFIQSTKELPPPPPSVPAPEEAEYLHSVLSSSPDIYRDYHCCETGRWVEKILEDEFANRLMDFNDIVFETIDSEATGINEIRCRKDQRYGILFRSIPEWKMVVLLTPFKGHAPIDEITRAYPDIAVNQLGDRQSVIRSARRAYPHALLLNPDTWIQVQKEKEGSMALSEEEIAVLESARVPQGGYPLFINGRAGSGKSTILQYLFSEYIYHSIIREEEHAIPVFFACNDELLARCSSGVKALVAGMFQRAETPVRTSRDVWEQALDRKCLDSFKNFHKWLQSLNEEGAFPTSRRFDYGRFKNWWERTFSRTPSARHLYGPDLSWHVIRTYIKGMDVDRFLDTEDYAEHFFSTRSNSVTVESYRLVFDTVWSRYSEMQKAERIWDDQDLARYVLEESLIPSTHPVVFSDEAQDFTRIELEILHRHSLFSNRTLAAHEQPQVPFAFAGDPFQTLNPTGFQWDSTRAFFTEKFIKTYPGRPKKDINYQELTYNYRSSAPVVEFCNTIQLLRKVLFGIFEIKPQLPWSSQENPASVVYFDRGQHDVLQHLKKQSEIRIIIPCEEGGEAEWTRENGLADYVEFDETGVPKNVSSASRVKGLEFTRVVLFGFGDACPHSLKQGLQRLDQAIQDDAAIEPQYFLNRLYVAASRPKKRLFIIDSAKSIRDFWCKMVESEDELLLRIRDTENWQGRCGRVLSGTEGSWDGDQESPEETAEILSKDARLRKDPFLYRQAAQYFTSAGLATQSSECRAEALELEEQFLDAARVWRELLQMDRSLTAAWKSGREGDTFIITLANAQPDLKGRMHVRFSTHLQGARELNSGVALLRDLQDALQDDDFREEVFTLEAWKIAILDCVKGLLKKDDAAPALWSACYSRIEHLDREGLRLPAEVLGDLAYRAGKMQEAFDHWNKVPAGRRSGFEKQYLRAEASLLVFPENLRVYGDLLGKEATRELADIVIAQAAEHPNISLEPGQHETLFRASLILSEFDKASEHLPFVKNEDLLLRFAEKVALEASMTVRSEYLSRAVLRWFAMLGEQGRWDEIVGICANGKRPRRVAESSVGRNSEKLDWIKENSNVIRKCAAQFFSETPEVEQVRNEYKTQMAKYLRDAFPVDFTWCHDVHPIIVGRAFERAGLFRETLPYYEAVAAYSEFNGDLVNLAWQRWIKTKIEQSRHEAVTSPKKAEKIDEEARSTARKRGIDLSKISIELPTVLPMVITPRETAANALPTKLSTDSLEKFHPEEAVNVKTSRANPQGFGTQTSLGEVQIRVSPNGKRVNFEHLESGEQAHVLVDLNEVKFEGQTKIVDQKGWASFSHWQLSVRIDHANCRVFVSSEDGTEMSLRVFDPENLDGEGD